MEREQTVIPLGRASQQTKGNLPGRTDVVIGFQPAGISRD
jgi:hypothetical protein